MSHIFISYAREDIEFAQQLVNKLEQSGLEVWIDLKGIPPTVDWWKEIERGIEEADSVLSLISPDYATSVNCGREVDHAIQNGKRLIPLLVRDVADEQAPSKLKHLNYIFFSQQDNFDSAFEKLSTAIQTDYDWVQEQRRLQVRAVEWDREMREKSFLLRGKDLEDAEEQLARNASKLPHPTELQIQYVVVSRKAADTQSRLITTISVATAIVLAALALFGFYQANNATNSQATAEANLVVAQTAQADAVQAEETAIANEQEAKRQANIALARQLAAEAQNIFEKGYVQEDIAALLATKSLTLYPSAEAIQVIQNNTLSETIVQTQQAAGITSTALSNNNKYLVLGSNDGTINLLSTETGKSILQFNDNTQVSAISFSPNDRLVASGGYDGIIHVRETNTGQQIAQMQHTSFITSLGFSPDGNYIVSGSDDTTTRIWDSATGQEILQTQHDMTVNSVVFSPNGKYMASGNDDGTIRIYDIELGKEISHYSLNTAAILSVDFSPNSKYVVISGSWDNTARVLDVTTGVQVSRMKQDDMVKFAKFSPSGNYVVSGGDDNTARVWNAMTGEEISRIRHNGSVLVAAFDRDENRVISGDSDGAAIVWEIGKGTEVSRTIYTSPVGFVAFSSDGKYTISSSYDGTVRISETVSQLNQMMYHEGDYLFFTALGPNEDFAVSGSNIVSENRDGIVVVWNPTTGQMIHQIKQSLSSMNISPDGRFVVTGDTNGAVIVRDIATGLEVSRNYHSDAVFSAAFDRDSKYVVSGGKDGIARVFEVSTGHEILRMEHGSSVTTVSFSPNSEYIVTGCSDHIVRVWDVSTSSLIAQKEFDKNTSFRNNIFSSDNAYIVSVAFGNQAYSVWKIDSGKSVFQAPQEDIFSSVDLSPDGNYVALGNRAGTVSLRTTTTGQEILRAQNESYISSLAFSPDGKYIASGNGEGIVHILEIGTQQEVSHIIHGVSVESINFSQDGRYLISGGCIKRDMDGLSCLQLTARVWLWKPEDLIADSCLRIGRNLSRAEWKQYVGDALSYQAICDHLPIESESSP